MPTLAIIILTIISILIIEVIITGRIYIKRQNLLNTLILTKLNEQRKIIEEMTGLNLSYIDKTGKIINN